MRELSEEFTAHLAANSTNLANCWKITRLDNIVLGFTDHDEELNFAGTVFRPAFGADISEVTSKLGAQTDSSEIIGIISSEAISEEDILLNRYDGAKVESYKVNWKDVRFYHHLRTDYIGEIVRKDNIFRVELRSAQHQLNIAKGRVYQSFCSAKLGDNKCSINLESADYRINVSVNEIIDQYSVAITLLSDFSDGFFSFGKAVWTGGKRNGKIDKIISQKNNNNQTIIDFSEPISDWVNIGDEFILYVGCDRHFSTCVEKFNNGINFRGFPHIPGEDFILRYPKKTMSFSGKPLFK